MVCQHLVVGNYDEDINAEVLKADAVLHGTEEMPNVKTARWAITSEHSVATWIDGQIDF